MQTAKPKAIPTFNLNGVVLKYDTRCHVIRNPDKSIFKSRPGHSPSDLKAVAQLKITEPLSLELIDFADECLAYSLAKQ